MKTIFVEYRYDCKERLKQEDLDKLPNNIALASSVQFLDNLDEIKKQLENSNKIITLVKGKHTKYEGQILGCDIYQKTKADAYLYIGDGMFHPTALALNSEKDVFVFNPLSKEFKQLDKSNIDRIKKQKKGQLVKFYSANTIGIIVSTKSGQNRMEDALKLKEKLDKQVFIFNCETFNSMELENFPFIESWINTMCPRIVEDIPMLNIDDIK